MWPVVLIWCSLLVVGFVVGMVIGYLLNRPAIFALKDNLLRLEKTLAERESQMKSHQDDYLRVSQALASTKAECMHVKGQLAEQGALFANIQERATLHFKQLANDLLEEKSEKFSQHSQLQLDGLLRPLREQLNNFEKQVTRVNQEHLERNTALRTEIRQLHDLNVKITTEAENLTKAIKGNSKLQGGWGEVILESILEHSGLVKNREYTIQSSFYIEDGKRYQPDVIINLPGKKHIIIDSKVSLLDYEKFFNEQDAVQRSLYLKQHIDSLRRHIRSLSYKNYASIYNVQGLDFVLMFVPIESAFIFAIQESMDLFNEAYAKNIIMVSPSNLMATLRTIANLWRQQYQHDNVLEIAKQGGDLFDKFVAFVDDIKSMGRQLALVQKNYDQVVKKLYEGKGSLVSRAEKMKKLGLPTNKSLD